MMETRRDKVSDPPRRKTSVFHFNDAKYHLSETSNHTRYGGFTTMSSDRNDSGCSNPVSVVKFQFGLVFVFNNFIYINNYHEWS